MAAGVSTSLPPRNPTKLLTPRRRFFFSMNTICYKCCAVIGEAKEFWMGKGLAFVQTKGICGACKEKYRKDRSPDNHRQFDEKYLAEYGKTHQVFANDQSRSFASNNGQRWTDHEDLIISDNTLSMKEMALRTGRTIRAVTARRRYIGACHGYIPHA
jgi:hypothetical protein